MLTTRECSTTDINNNPMEIKEDILDIGDEVWYPVPHYNHKGQDFIVKCRIDGWSEVWSKKDSKEYQSCWVYNTGDGPYHFRKTGKVDEGGWDICELVKGFPSDHEWKGGYRFYDLDEPIGHNVPIDELGLTLEQARLAISPSSKKHLKRRLRKWRKSLVDFIVKTHLPNHNPLSINNYPDKKVYIRNR